MSNITCAALSLLGMVCSCELSFVCVDGFWRHFWMLLIAFVVIMIPGLFWLWMGVSSMEMHGNINLCKELRRVTC